MVRRRTMVVTMTRMKLWGHAWDLDPDAWPTGDKLDTHLLLDTQKEELPVF